MSENPLLEVQFDIPFDRIKPEHIGPAVTELIAEAEGQFQAVLGVRGTRTYDNTLGALDLLGERLWHAWRLVAHLESVVTTPELRAAYNAVVPVITAFGTKLQLSEGLFRALQEFAQTPEAATLSEGKKRYLKLSLEAFRREGAALEPGKKERLEALNSRLSEITTRFGQNLTDSVAQWEMYLDEAQAAGLPQSALDAAKASAAAKGRGGYRFTLQQPSYVAIQTYLDDAAVREQTWRAYNNRATEEGLDNRPLIDEILALRREKADLLGYASFADYVTEDRMAANAANALAFERDLRAAYEPHFRRELHDLQTFRRQLEGPQAPTLQPWDIGYYAEKQRKALYDFDEEAVRPYFALPRVLEGLFELCRRVFGTEVREISGAAAWHPEVRAYEIRRGGRMVCRFFTDWHPRDTKRGGAWMNSLIRGTEGQPHLGLMCGNLTAPVGDRPALLTHREVETVFHEFGHLLHLALSEVDVAGLAGTQVARDFVELPSQIMENWCWERESLDLFAAHHQTGEPIPDDLFGKMTRAKNYWAANQGMRQLSFGMVDLALHVEYGPQHGDVLAYSRQVMQPFTPAPLPHDYAFVAGFSHIFSSPVGYAGGYYSYKWSEVLDADAFSRFKREGLFNPDTGRDFVEHVLSKGNSVDPAELFRRFMGRDPDPKALLARSGLLD